mmetsp:Transcript_15546/g.32136  ORF Transcript_15546/g.32136 Transcript_15546/m.32136 type:complete len:224 (-) Transcript_15546:1151-1822(-)
MFVDKRDREIDKDACAIQTLERNPFILIPSLSMPRAILQIVWWDHFQHFRRRHHRDRHIEHSTGKDAIRPCCGINILVVQGDDGGPPALPRLPTALHLRRSWWRRCDHGVDGAGFRPIQFGLVACSTAKLHWTAGFLFPRLEDKHFHRRRSFPRRHRKTRWESKRRSHCRYLLGPSMLMDSWYLWTISSRQSQSCDANVSMRHEPWVSSPHHLPKQPKQSTHC